GGAGPGDSRARAGEPEGFGRPRHAVSQTHYGVLSSPRGKTGRRVSWTYWGPSQGSMNQPEGHMVMISTREKPWPASWVSKARRSMRLVRPMATGLWTEPRAT